MYTIKGLKTFKGMEGMGGFNLTLLRDGKPVELAWPPDPSPSRIGA